jgi:hypothetical protein
MATLNQVFSALIVYFGPAHVKSFPVQWIATSTCHGYRIALCDGRDAWRVAPLLAEHKVPVIYDHGFTLPPRDSADHDITWTEPNAPQHPFVTVFQSPQSLNVADHE